MNAQESSAQQVQFVEQIEAIAHQMRGTGSTILDAAHHVERGRVEQATQLAARLVGRWLGGVIDGNTYFVENPETEAFEQVIMPPSGTSPERHQHELGAVLLGLESIEAELPNYSIYSKHKTRRGEVLCLKLNHLGSLAGIDQAIASRDPGWLRLKNHPFSRPQHACKTLWVPAMYVLDDSLTFVELPGQSG